MRITGALDRFVVQLEADGRSSHTIGQYRRHVVALARWLAAEGRSDDMAELDHEDLALFLTSPDARTSQRGGPKRATSTNALRTSLRCFFRYVHDAGWAQVNAARLVRRARCQGPPPRGLSERDQERLMRTLAETPGAERDHMLFHLLLGTGIRLSSALALTDRDVDLERGELVLWNAKGGKVERVILSRKLQAHLARYLDGRWPGPLFAGRDGAPISRRHAARRLGTWLERARCSGKTPPHGLRHAFAMGLYGRTQDLFLVKEALGHASVQSTTVYMHTDRERLRRELSA